MDEDLTAGRVGNGTTMSKIDDIAAPIDAAAIEYNAGAA
jgi:hypothetical protein